MRSLFRATAQYATEDFYMEVFNKAAKENGLELETGGVCFFKKVEKEKRPTYDQLFAEVERLKEQLNGKGEQP